MSQVSSKRSPCFDIIRCVALFCVVSLHFFLNNGYYYVELAGISLYISTVMRCLFMICVPLFVMLTGALMKNKTLSRGYYKKCIKTVVIYIMASIACYIYRRYFLFENMGIASAVIGILNFGAAPYGWYIEMYLGLFLLIPFLNLIYNNLPSRREKNMLIATMLVLTALPGVLNVYAFLPLQWWIDPKSSGAHIRLIPQWWVGIYPLTYYFLGCYAAEYKPKLKSGKNLLLIFLAALAYGSYCFWRSHGTLFVWGNWDNYGSLFIVTLTVLVFIFFMNLNYDRIPDKVRSILATASDCCLGAYLMSYIFDQFFYPYLNWHVPAMERRILFYIVIVPLVYGCSLAASYILNLIYRLGEALLRRCVHRA